MSHLIALSYPSADEAEAARQKLLNLEKAHLIDLEDAVVVVKDDKHRVRLRQLNSLPAHGAVRGGFWGLLLGFLFAAPAVGAAVGASAGAVSGAAADIGIDDSFMREMGQTLSPESAALFLLVRRATVDKVLAEFRGSGGTILQTSLSTSDEAQLQAALNRHFPEGAPELSA